MRRVAFTVGVLGLVVLAWFLVTALEVYVKLP